MFWDYLFNCTIILFSGKKIYYTVSLPRSLKKKIKQKFGSRVNFKKKKIRRRLILFRYQFYNKLRLGIYKKNILIPKFIFINLYRKNIYIFLICCILVLRKDLGNLLLLVLKSTLVSTITILIILFILFYIKYLFIRYRFILYYWEINNNILIVLFYYLLKLNY